jgi:hypothetical protein
LLQKISARSIKISGVASQNELDISAAKFFG